MLCVELGWASSDRGQESPRLLPPPRATCEWVQGLWQDWQCPVWAAGGAEAMRLPPWERVQTLRGGAGRGTLGGGWL